MDTLPNELLAWIVDQFSTDDYTRSLCNLSLVNRRLHRFTKEYIYKAVSFKKADPSLFLRAIALTPELGERVKSVDWCTFTRDNQDKYTSTVLSDADKLTFLSRLKVLQKRDDYTFGSLDPKITQPWQLGNKLLYAILFHTPNIEHLSFCNRDGFSEGDYWFTPISENPTLFQNLKSVSLQGPLYIGNVIPLLTLPSLRKFEATNVEKTWLGEFKWRRKYKYPFQVLAKGSNVEEIYIRGGSMHYPKLINIFSVCHRLRCFEYDNHNRNILVQSNTDSIGPWKIASTLEYLWIIHLQHFCYYDHLVIGQKPLELILRVLNNSPCLSSIAIGPLFAIRSFNSNPLRLQPFLQYLPKILEHLTFLPFFDHERIDISPQIGIDNLGHFLRSLASAARNKCRDLKTVTIQDWDPRMGRFSYEFPRVEHDFINAGLVFTVRYLEWMPQDLVLLEDVDEDWEWVQMVRTRDGKWLDMHDETSWTATAGLRVSL